MNSFGRALRFEIVGESHGEGIGAIIDGIPPGVAVDEEAIQDALNQRRPGTGPLVSQRKERDRIHIQAGVYNDFTTGAPVFLWIDNEDARSKDYDKLKQLPRPGHSDLVANRWSRGFNDPRGGGHYSGRLTAPIVAAGALLRPFIAAAGIRAGAHLHRVGDRAGEANQYSVKTMNERAETSSVHTAHKDMEDAFLTSIERARTARDSVGGIVEFKAEAPALLGDPFMDSVESQLAHILFAIPAVKGVDFGAGFSASRMMGSEHNDAIVPGDAGITTSTNFAGGILGGRSTGRPVWGHVAIKPTSSIFQPQQTVDLETGEAATLELSGRHDPCIAVRAVPVVRAAIEIALADLLLRARQVGHGGMP